MLSLNQNQITNLPKSEPQSSRWSVIIPAAGKGSRLGFHQPKILFPINDKPILFRLIDLLYRQMDNFVFIVSPSGKKKIQCALNRRQIKDYRLVIQKKPVGMADAILHGIGKVTTPYTLIMWGDQAAILPDTVEKIVKLQQSSPRVDMVLPL